MPSSPTGWYCALAVLAKPIVAARAAATFSRFIAPASQMTNRDETLLLSRDKGEIAPFK